MGGVRTPCTLPLYHGMIKFEVFMDWTRMCIEMGLATDLPLSSYNPFEICSKLFISGASNYVAITKVARIIANGLMLVRILTINRSLICELFH